MTIVEFLSAQLDKAEALAPRVPPSPWVVSAPDDMVVVSDDGEVVAEAFALHRDRPRHVAAWIAGNDPTFVLADIAAKRKIIALHGRPYGHECADDTDRGGGWYEEGILPYICPTLAALALPFADRPGYDEAWRV